MRSHYVFLVFEGNVLARARLHSELAVTPHCVLPCDHRVCNGIPFAAEREHGCPACFEYPLRQSR